MLRSIIPYKYTKAKKVFSIFSFVRRKTGLKIPYARRIVHPVSSIFRFTSKRLSVCFKKQTESLIYRRMQTMPPLPSLMIFSSVC